MPGIDDYPGEPQGRPRDRLYPTVVAKYKAEAAAFSAAANEAYGDRADEEYRKLLSGGEVHSIYYVDVLLPFEVDGSDSIQIINLQNSPSAYDGFLMLNTVLYADRSPFVREADQGVADETIPYYQVFIAPEGNPFIVSHDALLVKDKAFDFDISPGEYLTSLRQSGISPRELDDTESQQLLDALAQVQMDFDETLEHNL